MNKYIWKLLFIIFLSLAFDLFMDAWNSLAPVRCNGPDGYRENCLDEEEWEEYYNEELKNRDLDVESKFFYRMN